MWRRNGECIPTSSQCAGSSFTHSFLKNQSAVGGSPYFLRQLLPLVNAASVAKFTICVQNGPKVPEFMELPIMPPLEQTFQTKGTEPAKKKTGHSQPQGLYLDFKNTLHGPQHFSLFQKIN